MNIVLFVENFSVLTETFIYEKATRLAEAGHKTAVITLSRMNADSMPFNKVIVIPQPRKASVENIRYFNYEILPDFFIGILQPRKRSLPYHEIYKNYYRDKLKNLLLKLCPDLLIIHFGHMGCLVVPVSDELGIKTLVSFHGFDAGKLTESEKWMARYKTLWESAAVFTAPSASLRNRLIDKGIPPARIAVLPYGIHLPDWPYSSPLKRFDKETIIFLFTGRLVEKKDPSGLIEAFNYCRNELPPGLNARLIICGDGPLYEEVAAKISEYNLANHVEITGFCKREKVKEWMGMAHIYVQHSIQTTDGDTEGLPNSIIEAAASGLPVVSTKHAGIPEIVKDNVNGYRVEERDYLAMGRMMAKIACKPIKWNDFSMAGRKIVEQNFSYFNHIDTLLNLAGVKNGIQKTVCL